MLHLLQERLRILLLHGINELIMKKALLRLSLILFVTILMLTITSCEYFTKPSDTSEETSYKSEIFDILENYFSKHQPETSYFIVDSYADLCDIYEFTRIGPEWSSIFYIQGGVRNDYIINRYPEEYFDRGYVIAILTTASSGSWTFECSAIKNGNEIIVNLDGTLPAVNTADIGGFIYLVSFEGAYANERVEIVRTYTQLESYPAEEVTSFTETTNP